MNGVRGRATASDPPGVFLPAALLGAGLGGFVDGIVLHQILRWHHLLSARRSADLTANLVADGLFHAGAWLAVLAGVLWLWRRSQREPPVRLSWAALGAPMLVGWGVFNLVEGLVNHHLLRLHRVRAGPQQGLYDAGFLVLGGLLIIGGLAWYLARAGRPGPRPTPRRTPRPTPRPARGPV